MIDTFNGLPVMLSEYLVEDGEPYDVRRSWRERLFSRPWRPLQATYTVVPKVPMMGGYRMAHAIVMHPRAWRALQAALSPAPSIPGDQPRGVIAKLWDYAQHKSGCDKRPGWTSRNYYNPPLDAVCTCWLDRIRSANDDPK